MMLIVGLTGGIGSGKSAVSERFSALGVDIVDADVAARRVVEPGCPAFAQIIARHGQAVLDADGALDRKALRKLVFARDAERLWLEALLHPLIADELGRQISRATSPYSMLVSPLLEESGQVQLVNRVLVVDAPESVQVQRTLARDGGDETTVRAIINAQMSRPERLAMADDVIENDKHLGHLDTEVHRLHNLYMRLQ